MKIPKDKLSRATVFNNPPKQEPSTIAINRNGLGTKIHNFLKPFVTGSFLENCTGCKKRQEYLDKLFPGNPT